MPLLCNDPILSSASLSPTSPLVVAAQRKELCPLHYGRIRHELEVKGVMIGAMDLLIAAHALAFDAALVSDNLSLFACVTGLNVTNWLSES